MTIPSLSQKFLTLAALLFVFGSGSTAGAFPMPHQDLKTLVSSSSEILEGKIVERKDVGDEIVAKVLIERVHRGDLKEGKTVFVGGLQTYRKPGAEKGTNTYFEAGDRLFLFLEKPKICRGLCPLSIPLSGVKWITSLEGEKDKDRVVDSVQYSNPGPYVADPSQFKKKDLPMVEAQRKLILESVRD